jgi:hypothetical protein
MVEVDIRQGSANGSLRQSARVLRCRGPDVGALR